MSSSPGDTVLSVAIGRRCHLALDRRRKITELAQARGSVRVAELGKFFGVSGVTIRKDLEELSHEGVLVRDHGGAIPRTRTPLSMAFNQRAELNREVKQRIGEAAASLVQPGETIMLDAGSTLLEMAKRIPHVFPLTIITSALNIALQVGAIPNVHVMLAGGSLSPQTISTVGPVTERDLGELLVDRLFLGTHGFELDTGLSDVSIEVARVKRTMISTAKTVILLADSSKYEKRGLARVAPLSSIDCLITDTGFPEDVARRLAAQDIEVRRV